jgi:hypothetical protein
MVSCPGQYWLRVVGRANIRIQLSALRAAADTERWARSQGSTEAEAIQNTQDAIPLGLTVPGGILKRADWRLE